jgi:hypothetical protein
MNFAKLVSMGSLITLCSLSLMVVSSWATRQAINGNQRFSGGTGNFILTLAESPTRAKLLFNLLNNYSSPKGVSNIYRGYLEPHFFSNSLSGFVLVSSVSSNGTSDLSLIKLSNQSRRKIQLPKNSGRSHIYSDYLTGSEPKRQSSFLSRQRVWHPYLSKDGILTYIIPWNDLVSVDLRTGQEKWRIRGAFHHSIELDANGDLWVCGAVQPQSISKPESKTRHSNKIFEDQVLVKVSPSGKILLLVSVADLILNSGLEYLMYGSSNPNVNFDPIHLNQITPIVSDSGLFKKGQVLISLRNMSTIMLIEPDSQSVVWYRSGNWMNQHCVFPIGPSTFSLLDNHSFASGEYWLNSTWRSRIVKYNIETGESSEVQVNDQSHGGFYIPIEGRVQSVGFNHWMIEDCLNGTIMIFGNQKLLFKWSNLYYDGTVGITSWCRYMSSESIPEFMKN